MCLDRIDAHARLDARIEEVIKPFQVRRGRLDPTHVFRDLPIGIDGLYLGGAGCHGGPGITFIPGYNAGYQVLYDLG